jgi:GDPmannose 4,6-dehydratase
MRPAEVDMLVGDPTKARERLGWQPDVKFDGLVDMMVDADIETVQREIDRGETSPEMKLRS